MKLAVELKKIKKEKKIKSRIWVGYSGEGGELLEAAIKRYRGDLGFFVSECKIL